mmetsp:Transcript_16957/g.50278  ORF Transcript_16957/g.50278 Transcript_16957/m.50278 type:complete len:206 (+) Transcript_16957:517-1134(+)
MARGTPRPFVGRAAPVPRGFTSMSLGCRALRRTCARSATRARRLAGQVCSTTSTQSCSFGCATSRACGTSFPLTRSGPSGRTTRCIGRTRASSTWTSSRGRASPRCLRRWASSGLRRCSAGSLATFPLARRGSPRSTSLRTTPLGARTRRSSSSNSFSLVPSCSCMGRRRMPSSPLALAAGGRRVRALASRCLAAGLWARSFCPF